MSKKAPSPGREQFKAFRPVSTRWRDNDVYGHVNNVVYYEYFDTAVNGYLIDTTGIDIREMSAIGVVVETGCQFFESVSFPETLEIGLAVTYIGQSSIQYRLGVFRRDAQQAAAEGRFVHVYVDAKTRTKVAIPAQIAEAAAQLVFLV